MTGQTVREALTQTFGEVMNNPKVAVAVSGLSALSYPAAAMGLVQSWLSVVASGVGIVLSAVLICNHIISGILSRRELRLKIEKLEAEAGERRAAQK
jgi:hypothetical protein